MTQRLSAVQLTRGADGQDLACRIRCAGVGDMCRLCPTYHNIWLAWILLGRIKLRMYFLWEYYFDKTGPELKSEAIAEVP